MDMQIANKLSEAASGFDNALDKAFLIVKFNAEISGMIAANKQREFIDKSIAYTDEEFYQIINKYEDEFKRL